MSALDARLAVATRTVAPTAWVLPADDPTQTSGDLAELLRGFGFDVAVARLGGATDKPSVIASIYEAIEAPEWAGHNWDALFDVLLLRFADPTSCALLLADPTAAVLDDSTVGAFLNRILVDVAETAQGSGRAFYGLWLGNGPHGVPVVADVL